MGERVLTNRGGRGAERALQASSFMERVRMRVARYLANEGTRQRKRVIGLDVNQSVAQDCSHSALRAEFATCRISLSMTLTC